VRRLPIDDEYKRLAEQSEKLIDYAAPYGLTVAYHAHPRCTIESEEEQDHLLAYTDRLKVCVDVSVAALMGEDAIAQLRKYRNRLAYVHLKDWKGRQVLPDGQRDSWIGLQSYPRDARGNWLLRLGDRRVVQLRGHRGHGVVLHESRLLALAGVLGGESTALRDWLRGNGHRHILAYKELADSGIGNVEVVAVCDLRPENAALGAREVERLLGTKPMVITDLDQALANPHVVAVDVVTDPSTHHAVAVPALQAGKHAQRSSNHPVYYAIVVLYSRRHRRTIRDLENRSRPNSAKSFHDDAASMASRHLLRPLTFASARSDFDADIAWKDVDRVNGYVNDK
jgi:hypothetical protein